MSSVSSGLLCRCGPELPAMWESPGHEMPMKEGEEKPHHRYAILPRPLLHWAHSLHYKYSQGKEKCPSLGQTLPLQDSKALQGRESVGGAGFLQRTRSALGMQRRDDCNALVSGAAEHPFPFAALLRVGSSTGWRLQFFTGSSEEGFAVEGWKVKISLWNEHPGRGQLGNAFELFYSDSV